jgi:hypothetical protein
MSTTMRCEVMYGDSSVAVTDHSVYSEPVDLVGRRGQRWHDALAEYPGGPLEELVSLDASEAV